MEYIIKGLKNIIYALKNNRIQLLIKTFSNYLFAYLKIPFLTPLPIEIQIEPSSVCNLACLMCNLKNYDSNHHFLTPVELRNIINQIKPLKNVSLTGMGESLLNPNFLDLIKVLKENHISFSFITNGLLLTPKYSEKILLYHPLAIAISLESADPKTYENIRKGASFEKLKINIQHLVKVQKILSPKTNIVFNTVLLKSNISNIENIYKIIDFSKSLDIKQITFQNPFDLSDTGLKKYIKEIDILEVKYNLIYQYASRKGISITLPSTDIIKNTCYYPWILPQITSSGEMLPCCVIPQYGIYSKVISKYSFGNIISNSFVSTWRSKKANKFRQQLSTDLPPSPCKNCPKFLHVL